MLGLTNTASSAPNPTGFRCSPPRREDALLLACTSANPARREREALRWLTCECKDWDYLVETARQHGVTALVSSRLEAAAADLVPHGALDVLRNRFRANAARNLFLTKELLAIIRDFVTHGIDVIPFKGPVLAITAYGNLAMREFLDLDILVTKEHLERAGQLLIQRGYLQPADQIGGLGSGHVESQLGCDFFRHDGRVSIELHWSFLQRWLGFEVELGVLWGEPTRLNVGGTQVLTLPAEITLLYLCAHGTKHRWSRLCWVVDVAQLLLSHPTLDWDGLLQTAKKTGSRRTLFLGLHLARCLLDSELPEKICVQMKKDLSATTLAGKLCRGIFPSEGRASTTSAGLARDWFYLRTRERWRDRLLYLRYSAAWLLLPSRKDREWVRLPASLNWLYLFLRPVRVACAAVRLRAHRMC